MNSLFHPFSKRIGYCCATNLEKEAIQTNLECDGSPLRSYGDARRNRSSYPRLRIFELVSEVSPCTLKEGNAKILEFTQ